MLGSFSSSDEHNITVTSENTCGVCLVDLANPEARFTHEVIEHGQNVDPALKKRGSRHQVTQQFHDRFNKGYRPQPRPPGPSLAQNGVAPPPPRPGGLRIRSSSELMAPAPLRVPGTAPQRGKISIRPVHTMQAGPPPPPPLAPRMAPPLHAPSPARLPVVGSGYVMVPANVNGPGPPLYYMVRPEQINPVTGLPPPVVLSPLPPVAPAPPTAPPPPPPPTQPPETLFCKTCGSEFSTLLNLKLHANVMNHELPDGVGVGPAFGAGGLGAILRKPELENGAGEGEVVDAEVRSPGGEDEVDDSWTRGRTEIRKRKLPEGEIVFSSLLNFLFR